jgi:starch-binding outer membrane protein, SusD/RagB family
MTNRFQSGRGLRALPRLLLTAGLALPLVACDTDALLEVDEPTFATPGTLANPAGLPTLYAGAVGDFQIGYSGRGGSVDNYLSVSSLFSDELWSSDTFTTRNATDSRNQFPTIQGNTSDAVYNHLQYARRATAEVAEIIAEVANTQDPRYAVLKSLEGHAILALADAFCGAVPLGAARGGAPGDDGQPLNTTQLYEAAVQRFDAALAGSPNSNLAKVGKGRALVSLGRLNEAAAAVQGVPTSFVHFVEHSSNATRQHNPIYALQDNRRYSMANREGGNGYAYVESNDPRTPWNLHPQGGFDQATPVHRSLRYPTMNSNVPLADGIQARLIEAEAALAAGNAQWLTILNDLRAQVRPLMTARFENYAANVPATNTLAPLTDPGNAAARLDMLMRERAFWLYLTGTRMGDMRRMVRNYNRPVDSVFPTGAWHKGGSYGEDVTFPIPFNETQNPNYEIEMCNVRQP